MAYRPKRKRRKDKEEEWKRKMQAIDERDHEARRQSRQESSAPAAVEASIRKSDAPAESKEKETIGSKSGSSVRLKESPPSSKPKARASSPSSRYDEGNARSKDQDRGSKYRRKFSLDSDSDEDPGDHLSPDKTYRRNITFSQDSKSPDDKFRFSARRKKRRDGEEDHEDHSIHGKTCGRNRLSSPVYKSPDKESPSSGRRKEKKPGRRDRFTREEEDESSKASPKIPGRRSGSSLSRLDDGRRLALEKVSSSSQSTESTPIKTAAAAAAENFDESDSDASFDLLSIKRKRDNENMINRKSKNETTERNRPEKSVSSPKNTSRRRNRSFSLSEAEEDEGDPLEEGAFFRLEKDVPRKRRATNDDGSECSFDRKPKRRRESSISRYTTASHSVHRRDRFDDEGSVQGSNDEDYHKRPSSRQDRNLKPRSSATSKYDTDEVSSNASEEQETNEKPQPTSFVVADDDDGFMSDCEPSPEPLLKKSKKKSSSRYQNEKASPDDGTNPPPKKRGRRKRNDESGFDFDDDDSLVEVDMGGSVDELHPIFENPKFGPYEPMEPLVLSNTENEPPIEVPASLSRYLAPFQKEGIRFIYDCLARQSGAILGDEMGCGKTVQVISLLCALFQKTGTRKDVIDNQQRNVLVRKKMIELRKQKDQALRMGEVLDENIDEWKASLSLSPWNPCMIIVPPTIVDTWKNAFKTFSHFSASFYSSKTKVAAINSMIYGSADILVVPKSAFQDEKHLDEFGRVNWKLVVIDEFHNFKNHKAKISKNLRALKELHQPLVLGMTGTLMQNNHTELWNLVDLVETNYFGSLEDFKEHIERPITQGRHKCADRRSKARSEAASSELRKRLGQLYIKRSKKDVLKGQLPDKNEEFILCELSPLQKEVYKHVVQLPDFDLVKHGSRPCDCGINQNFFRDLLRLKNKAEQLEYMRRNKKMIVNQAQCCKKVPINPRFGEEGEPRIDQDAAIWRTLDDHCARKTTEAVGSPAYIKYMKEREFAKVALVGVVDRLPGRIYDRNDGIMDDHFGLSGKLKVLNNLLQKDYQEGRKVLLFSHSTQSLGLIQNWLKSRGSYEYLRMDGSTPTAKRQELADEFNNTPHIFLFLLSIKATGLGLNLTSANRVIMFDVSWNPSWEIQAQDRAHRIGQTRNVHVVRLISKGTVEEMMYLRQIYKEHLKQDTLEEEDEAVAPRVFRGIQGNKYQKGELFGTENLFRFKAEGSFLQDIYNMRPGSRGKGNGNSSGFDIHDSRKVSEVLLGMTDKEKSQIGERDDLVAIKALPVKPAESEPQDSTRDTGSQESQSSDKKPPAVESAEKDFDARNYRDLFRSDRGGAAIEEGEEGFDEEMGGQTQAAYEVYENIKGNLQEEEENNDDDVVDKDNEANDADDERAGFKNKSVQVKRETPETVGSMLSMVQAIAHARPDSISSSVIMNAANESSNALRPNECKLENFSEPHSERTPAIESEPPTDSNSCNDAPDQHLIQCKLEEVSESIPEHAAVTGGASLPVHGNLENLDRRIDVAQEAYESTTSKRQTRHKNILLMGHIDIYKANTEITDIKRPDYKKKKRKKNKKKKDEVK